MRAFASIVPARLLACQADFHLYLASAPSPPSLSDLALSSRFGRHSTSSHLYTIINCSPSVRTRKPGRGEKKSFVSLWDTKTWELKKTRGLGERPVTGFDVR